MFGYDLEFASIAAADYVEGLRKSYVAGRVPYRSIDASRDRDEAVRPVLTPAFGAARGRCDADVSHRAA